MNDFTYHDIEILRIPVNPIFKLMDIYLYYIDGLLIDTGPRIMKKWLIPFLDSREINGVAITHHHEDHVGMASWIAEQQETSIYSHEKSVQVLKEELHIMDKMKGIPAFIIIGWKKNKGNYTAKGDKNMSNYQKTCTH